MPTATKPRRRRRARKCRCGCEQAPAETTRLRKLTCLDCGYVLRVTREWIARGMPTCACGGPIEPVCLLDRIGLPDEQGREAWAEYAGREAWHAILSERAKKAARSRHRCKHAGCGAWVARGRFYCARHAHLEMPF